ncbi:MAG: hypothetical protein GY943_05900 [Chloroflexi bacterium]|nr:hypothetical protein [Chloroflexota bacterium]
MTIELLECEQEFTPLVQGTKVSIKATADEVGGNPPSGIIRADQDWYVDVEWEMTGGLIRHFCGNWCLSVALDAVGPGEDYQIPSPPVRIPMDPCGDGKYSYRINVKAGEVAARDCDGTVYIFVVTLGSTDPCGKSSHIFAHCTGGHLHVVPGPSHDC